MHPTVQRAQQIVRRIDYRRAREKADHVMRAVTERQRRDHAATFVRKVFVNPSAEELERKEARMQRHRDSIARAHAVLNRHEPKPDDGLIFKRFEMPRAVETQSEQVEPQPRQATQSAANGGIARMTVEKSQPWNDWLESSVRKLFDELFMPAIGQAMSEYVYKRLEDFAEIVGEGTGKAQKKQNGEFDAKIAGLQASIDALQAAVDELRAEAESADELKANVSKLRTEFVLLDSKIKRAAAKPSQNKNKRVKGRR